MHEINTSPIIYHLVKKRKMIEENHLRALARMEASKKERMARLDTELTEKARNIDISCAHCAIASLAPDWKFIYETLHSPSIEYSDHWSEESWAQRSDLLSHLICPNCKKLNLIAEHEQREIIIELLKLEKRSKIGKFGRSNGYGSNHKVYLEDQTMCIIDRVGEMQHGKVALYED